MARNYAAIPHDYLEEMVELDDAEFGRLIRAVLAYSITGETSTPSGNERFVYRRAIMQEQRFQDSYEEVSSKNRANGKKGGRPRKTEPQTEPQTETQTENPIQTETPIQTENSTQTENSVHVKTNTQTKTQTNPTKPNQTQKTQTKTETKTETKTKTKLLPSTEGEYSHTRKKTNCFHEVTVRYGKYGWVTLGDLEFLELRNELGEQELERCITYLDESAQSTGNKNHWQDWALLIRRCHRDQWGIQKSSSKSSSSVSSTSSTSSKSSSSASSSSLDDAWAYVF